MASIKEENKGTLLDNPETKADVSLIKTEDFIRKNKNILLAVAGIIVLAIGGFIYYKFQSEKQNVDAQNEMFQAVYYFEADSLDKALKGDGKDLGFLDIADEYGNSKAGNLARFYSGVIYLKKGKFDEAIEYLKKFSSDDIILQGRAYSLIGDAYLEQKDLESAIEFYNKAADYYPNEFFSPRYLMKAALAYELNNDYNSAAKVYDKIIEKYSKSMEANDAKKFKARAEELATK